MVANCYRMAMNFKFKIGDWCLYKDNNPDTKFSVLYTCIYIAIGLSILAAIVYLIKRSSHVLNKITEPLIWRNYDETYCTVSLDIIWYTRILLYHFFIRIIIELLPLFFMGKYFENFTT